MGRLLDRKVGEQLLRHALSGGYPTFPQDRTEDSLNLLFSDRRRQGSDQFVVRERSDAARQSGTQDRRSYNREATF